MPASALVPLGIQAGGSALGALLGGTKSSSQALVPNDMTAMRGQQLGLLNYLLGMGPDPRTQDASTFGGGARTKGREGGNPLGAPQTMDVTRQLTSMAPGMTPNINVSGGGVMTPQQRLESFFGQIGVNRSPLQGQGSNALAQFLNQPSPEQRASEIALPGVQRNLNGNPDTQTATNRLMGLQTGAGADVEGRLGQIGQGPLTGNSGLDQLLQSIAGGTGGGVQFQQSNPALAILQQLAGSNPGQGVVDALQPTFQQGLAAANQTGGRFGSSNAILRSRALDDYNLRAQQALQQGVTQQTNAASSLGQLALGGNELDLRAALGNQGNQLNALQMLMQGRQGMDSSALNALQSLGSLRLQGQGQEAQNLQAAGNLGVQQGQLGNQSADLIARILGQQGGAERENAMNAFTAGQTETAQGDVGTQRTLDLLTQLLGTAQSTTLGAPVQRTPSGLEQGTQLGSALAQLFALAGRKG